MIDLNDFIIKGKYKKKYKCTCDKCSSDRGYRYKEDSSNLCYKCAIEARNKKMNFEPIPDLFFIKDDHGTRKYKATCSLCGKDRGHVRKRNLHKRCLSCARKEDHSKREKDRDIVVHRKLRHNIKSNLNRALRRHKGSKMGLSIIKLLNYSIDQLKTHLELKFLPDMTWENYGQWHIDHIVPDSWFTYSSVDDQGFKDSWDLSNLQPLWAKENIKKSNKYSG